MPVQPRTPQGVLELLPPQQLAFQRMLDTIRRGFERFGFLPVETPAFELTDILLTKSGGETEKQVYFVQSTGSIEQGHRPEMALRFDLTVPLARYVAQHEHQLNFPFRRYQIQRVYRGERAQKGRFREFYQCDIDVIGKDTLPLAYDAELPALIHGIFSSLNFGPFKIYINNRKLLRGLLESFDIEKQTDVLHEVDRLGKIELSDVEAKVATVIGDTGKAHDVLQLLSGSLEVLRSFQGNDTFKQGLADLTQVYETTLALGVPRSALEVKLSIVRGLDYYTGTVYETFLTDHPRLGSICSGGRYDNLAEHYTKSKLPGVGISIGATRLFSQLLEMGILGAADRATARALVLHVEKDLALEYARIAAELRGAGLNVEVYGGDDKLGKQFKYADRAGVPLAILYGGRERDAGIVKIKDLRNPDPATNKEIEVPRGELVARVTALLATPPTR
jgi:histidyl-tRNA synthetase